MKHLLVLLGFLSIHHLSSQPISTAWSKDFYNWLEIIVPASDGGWYASGQTGHRNFNNFPEYDGYMVKLDAKGTIQWVYLLPSEVMIINDIIEVNQDLIVFAAQNALCDVFNAPSYYGAVNANGNELWVTSNWDNSAIPRCDAGARMYLLPNKSIDIYGGADFANVTVNANGMQVKSTCKIKNNGSEVWARYSKSPNGNMIGLSHQSNEVLLLGSNCTAVQKFKLGWGEASIAIDTGNNIFCIRDTVVYQLNAAFVPVDTFSIPNPYVARRGFVEGTHPKFLLQSTVAKEKYVLYHLPKIGVPFIEHIPENYWIQDIVTLPKDSVLYFGTTLLEQLEVSPIYYAAINKDANSYFIHKTHSAQFFDDDIKGDLEFQEIQAPNPELYTTSPCGFQGGANNYKFKNVLCKFKNTGSTIINDFRIKLRYNKCSGICAAEQEYNYPVSNQLIAPGENFEFELPPFTIVEQNFGPGQKFELCAWIVEPNQQPQSHISNDYACTKVDIISAVNGPGSTTFQFSIQPNPVDEIAVVKFDSPNFKNGNLVLFNLFGEIVYSTPVISGVQDYSIPMSNVSSGMYFCQYQIEGFPQAIQKIVKK